MLVHPGIFELSEKFLFQGEPMALQGLRFIINGSL